VEIAGTETTTMTKLLLGLLALNVIALVAVTVLYRRAKKAQRQRRVEAPNSQYKSHYVMDLEAKNRWERLDLNLLHEVNREEFEKLLSKVKATSVRALSPQERAFLDRMVVAEDRVRRSRRRDETQRHPRPAHGTG
jgi:hypothetical protein